MLRKLKERIKQKFQIRSVGQRLVRAYFVQPGMMLSTPYGDLRNDGWSGEPTLVFKVYELRSKTKYPILRAIKWIGKYWWALWFAFILGVNLDSIIEIITKSVK